VVAEGEGAIAAACYLVPVLGSLYVMSRAPYRGRLGMRFHAYQGLFFFVALFTLWLAMELVMAVAGEVPILGLLLGAFGVAGWIMFLLGSLILWFGLVVQTLRRKRMLLPLLGPLAEKQAQPAA
jgi:uncharacterized membrane protein